MSCLDQMIKFTVLNAFMVLNFLPFFNFMESVGLEPTTFRLQGGCSPI